MSRFNTSTVGKNITTNYEGARAYKESSKLELASILLTSFVDDKFYTTANETMVRLVNLILETDPLFVAKAAILARREYGMRSITHVVAGEIAKLVKGEVWTKHFFNQIIRRPDDMTEILSYYLKKFGKPIPTAMKKGFAEAISRFDGYSLAKYRGEKNEIKLVDIVNLVHPKPCARNEEALRLLVNGGLKSEDTWETMLTRSGQNATSDEEKIELKNAAWATLVSEKKLRYFGLLRNIRNLAIQAPDSLNEALVQLVDENEIRKSLVLPFRFQVAYKTIMDSDKIQNLEKKKILAALDTAATISLSNLQELSGTTLIALDRSGSMNTAHGRSYSPIDIASLFAASLYKRLNADIIVFSDVAKYASINPNDGVLTIAEKMRESLEPKGTNFQAIFDVANRGYDRIIILSDMQAWMKQPDRFYMTSSPVLPYREYCKKYGVTSKIWSFDLAGYGTLQFPEKNVYCLAGFSEKVFDLMPILEEDQLALIHKIDSITF